MKKVTIITSLLVIMSLLIVGCGSKKAKKEQVTYATIAGKIKVTKVDLNDFTKGVSNLTIAEKNKAVNELILVKLFNYVGTEKKYQESEAYKNTIKKIEPDILLDTAYNKYIKNNIKISDEDYKTEFNKEKSKFIIPKKVVVSQIVVKTVNEATTILSQLNGKKGDDLNKIFATIAKTESIDKFSGKKGGLVGTFNERETPAYFRTAIFGMTQPGVYTTAIENAGTYTILKVDKIIPAKPMTLTESKPILKQIIEENKIKAHEKSWTATTLKKYGTENLININKIINNKTIAPTKIIATFDGKNITVADVMNSIPKQVRAKIVASPKYMTEFINGLILQKLLKLTATKNKIQNSTEYKRSLSNAKEGLLAQLTLKKEVFDKIVISDKDAKTFYAKLKSQAPATEQIRPYSAVKDKIVAQLKQMEAANKIKEWYDVNKAKYVKINEKNMPIKDTVTKKTSK